MNHTDFIPRPDGLFDQFFKNILQYVASKTPSASPAWTHIPVTDRQAINNSYAEWYNAYSLTLVPHAPQLTREKNRVRLEAERSLRAFINRFLRWPPVTDLDRDNMGIRNWDTIPTEQPAPTTIPEIEVDTSVIRLLSMRMRDFGASTWGRPEHVHAIELAWGITDARPADAANLPHLETASANPIVLEFHDEERGSRVFFAARWLNNTMHHGPWSDLESAVIP